MSPQEHKVERRLVALFAADVAGYSRLIEQDEAETLRSLTAHRLIMDRLIVEYGGRIANTAGDSVLAEFPSAIDAVRCATQVQNEFASFHHDRPEREHIQFRIGIHVGDVVVSGCDLLGDAVNIAARLEGIADPGGICISEAAYGYVRKAIPLAFTDLGPQTLKNIGEPIRVYAQKAPQLTTAGIEASKPLPLPDKPSIAVLAFTNMGGDPEQGYFADGIAEDLITALSRLRWLFVIARNSTFVFKDQAVDVTQIGRRLGVRYVLEGSIRKAGARVRITGQLIEAATGAHIWAERYDRNLTDIFDVQDEIAQSVVAAIEPTLRKAEIERVQRKRPDDLNAYDLYLQALAHMYEQRPESRAAALELIDRALKIAPKYAEAHGVAAWCYFARSLWEGSLPEPHRDAMLRHARAVQELQTDDATTLAHAAIALALVTRDYEAALEMIDRAIMLNPSSAHAHGHGSVINTWAGRYDRSIALSERALRLSPFDPLSVMPLAGRAGAHMMKGEHEEAVLWTRRALQIYPNHTPSFLIRIVSLMRLGRTTEAQATAQQFMAIAPTYRIIPNAPVLGQFCEELGGAGLPN
jgi:adenylate cyclase